MEWVSNRTASEEILEWYNPVWEYGITAQKTNALDYYIDSLQPAEPQQRTSRKLI